ncbi:MAG: EVE domain-containing protein [Chitinophagales bacterium]|nr:EVE domain-containing protein [Chitinophagales bacterium]
MQYWLMKSEPNTFSYDDLIKVKLEPWDGVRNYQARNNMKLMKKGDLALFYHSVNEKAIVGIMKIAKEYHQDPTTDDERWVCVSVSPVKKVNKVVTLADVKANKKLAGMQLINNSRLSVQEVSPQHFEEILKMADTKL